LSTSKIAIAERHRLQRCADEVGQGGRLGLLLGLQIHNPKLFKILAVVAEESSVEDAR
jgi:hypothetical protein